MVLPVRKAVFPVAGLGTRLLPATKVLPKEMLPIVDRPLIEYAVQEALDAGIEDFIFVTGRGKSLIEDHFDNSYELEAQLVEKDKKKELATVQKMTPNPGHLFFTRQQVPLGLGHAVWCARQFIAGEPGDEYNGGAGFLVEAEYGHHEGVFPKGKTTAPPVWAGSE